MRQTTTEEPLRTAAAFVPLEEAARRLGYDGTEWREAARRQPVRWPAEYLALAESPDGLPIRRMGIPDPAELRVDAAGSGDPVGDALVAQHPYLLRKYRDRALLLVTARCHFYCRFCFRRSFPDGAHRDPSAGELDEALAVVAGDDSIRELILSGGDPLSLDDDRLEDVVGRAGGIPHVDALRVHTRAPVHHPERVTTELASRLARAAGGKPLRVVTHFAHPVELRLPALAAVRRLQAAGLPILNQCALLAGVNDAAADLAALFRGLAAAGVRNYYLHHPDRAEGNAAFRVPVARGREIFAELRRRVPATLLPAYVVDLPDGSGKVPVEALVPAPGGWCWPRTGFVLDEPPWT